MSPRQISKNAVAAEVWRRLFDFLIATRAQRDRVLAGFGLTPNDARALNSLDLEEGRSMSSLAEAWGCDASNATWMIDRLERRGLARRRSAPRDRRVKLVVLTSLGRKTRADLLEGVYQPPPELLELDRADLDALRKAVAKLPAGKLPPGRMP
jgi:DNA-binding MarR family transcriptional regulator